jgi:hypothetical protein
VCTNVKGDIVGSISYEHIGGRTNVTGYIVCSISYGHIGWEYHGYDCVIREGGGYII